MDSWTGWRERAFQWGHLVPHPSSWRQQRFGWSAPVVMRLPSTPTDTRSDFPSWICAFPEWLASRMIFPAGMEEARAAEGEGARAPGEGAPGAAALRAARGCTSSPWPREPGLWPSTTPTPSSRTASPSTAPSSSSARTTSSGSTPSGSQSGHILPEQVQQGLRSARAPPPKACLLSLVAYVPFTPFIPLRATLTAPVALISAPRGTRAPGSSAALLSRADKFFCLASHSPSRELLLKRIISAEICVRKKTPPQSLWSTSILLLDVPACAASLSLSVVLNAPTLLHSKKINKQTPMFESGSDGSSPNSTKTFSSVCGKMKIQLKVK